MEIVDYSLINIVYRLRGGSMIKLKVQLYEDPNKIIEGQISQTRSVRTLIKLVYLNISELSIQNMQLRFRNIILDPSNKVSQYNFLIPGALLIQEKILLSKVPGVNVTKSQAGCLPYDDDITIEKAIMPCHHSISTEYMVDFLKSVVSSQALKVQCPGLNSLTKKPCLVEWPFDLCKRVAILSKSE